MDARHHRVSREIIFVPVPFEGGSPKTMREVKRSRPYPSNQRQPWRRATRPPSKAAATVNLVRRIAEHESAVRDFMQQVREGSRHAN
jgi:hypothetical protein